MTALVLALLVVLWIRSIGREARSITTLPGWRRQSFVAAELESFRALCTPQPADAALSHGCNEKARLLLELPECDAQCRTLVERFARETGTR